MSGSEGTKGARDGNIGSSTFSRPESLAVFTINATKTEMAKSLKPIWLADLTNEACLYVNQRNYTTCGVVIDRDFPYEIIDHQRVKYIPFGNFDET